jgi:CheY-like chemotaxis protein/anti-sigma regulatory factor (Ser/Thr protein kinase)
MSKVNKILVIEDEEAVRTIIVEMLDAEGFNVLEAENGVIGAQLAHEYLPDLVLCDVTMPQMDGHAVLKALRQDASTMTMPFVYLTAKADWADVRQGMELGADDYLIKPFKRDELLKAISTRLAKQSVIAAQTQSKLDELRGSIALALPHEMRTPLTSIMAYSEMLAVDCDSKPPLEIREMSRALLTGAQRLYNLTANFMLYAELEIASRDPAYAHSFLGDEACRAQPVVTDTAIQLARRAGRDADLGLTLQDGVIAMAEPHVHKITDELLSNAFKFSPPGTSVDVTGFSNDHVYTLSVQDHGRGMTARQIADVGACLQFERKRHEQQGQGLGLAIVKRLVELRGGTLHIESVYGRQTTVRVTLPAESHNPN